MDASDTAGAIVVAAGESLRMAGVDKIFAPLMGRPLIAHSLSVINDSPHVSSIVLVLSSGTLDQGRRLAESNGWGKVKHVCVGGARRQDSVRLGLELLPESDWVIVHDGARPILDEAMIGTALEAARPTGAAVAAVPVKDTIKLADADGVVTETLHRDRLWAAQTPQVFRRQLLAEAHRRIIEDVTDDASMVELMGAGVQIFMGSHDNIKVTTPDDLAVVESILSARRSGAAGTGR